MRALSLLVLTACTSAPAATSDFFGPTIEPPHGLAQLAPGMSVDEAMRRVPALRSRQASGHHELDLDSGVSDVKLAVRVESGTVASLVATVQGQSARALLTRAWGAPQMTRDALGQPEITWASETTGWKVKLDCMERNCLVEYTPYHVLTSELFGHHVVPPGDLAKLHIGMPLAEAKQLAPGPVNVRAGIATRYDGVREYVALDDKAEVIRSIYLNVPPHADAIVEEAWGPPTTVTWPVGKSVKVWLDPSTSWRALLRPALGASEDLVFENYLPLDSLVDDVPAALLGRAVGELEKTYGDHLAKEGHDLVLVLPPTDWERAPTAITLETSAGRVRALALSVGWQANPAARAQLLERFQTTPRLELREDAAHEAWQITIH